MLIVLPSHLEISGVTTWAMQAVEGLRAIGEHAGILVHTHPGQPVPGFLEPFVVGRVACSGPIDTLGGRIEPFISAYSQVVERVYTQTGQPVTVVPCMHGDCAGAAAGLTQSMHGKVRMVYWMHSDNAYDLSVAAHYESACSLIACVSASLQAQACERLPDRAGDILQVPNTVRIPELVKRAPINGRPLRIAYTGRLDEHQKRVSSLPPMLERLDSRGVKHELRIVGDGDSADSLRTQIGGRPGVRMLGAVRPDEVGGHLSWADVWVLPSRYEGQSIAMMEAMAHGCVPVVTRVRSGAVETIQHGENGFFVDADPEQNGETVGRAMGDVIAGIDPRAVHAIGRRAAEFVAAHHDPVEHARTLQDLCRRAMDAPARQWAGNRPCSYTGWTNGGSGSTPECAPERMRPSACSVERQTDRDLRCGQAHDRSCGGACLEPCRDCLPDR